MMYNIGIKPHRHGYKAVVLEDGEFLRKFELDLTPKLDRSNQFNRNYHLTQIYETLEENTTAHYLGDISICVEALDYGMWGATRRGAVEHAQVIGVILSMPYTVHEVSSRTWQHALVGKGGVTRKDVRDVVEGRFPELAEEFGGNDDWFDAFLLGRFGYIRDSEDSVSSVARAG